ncbi:MULTISPECIES: hypothetical protein [Halorussus]|uniref:hypothetical protein n=1 Tax=Halorussus TaxID=1070314 RepID=UPI00209FD75E|nr:hypothetical protein [Halorussus vallis]USZ75514.1 hypothetical protein NGM07_19040 [Halorussus vallis]
MFSSSGKGRIPKRSRHSFPAFRVSMPDVADSKTVGFEPKRPGSFEAPPNASPPVRRFADARGTTDYSAADRVPAVVRTSDDRRGTTANPAEKRR